MQTSEHEPRIVRVIESCKQPDQLKNCLSWVDRLRAIGTIPPASAERLQWLVSMKLDGAEAIQ